MGPLLGPGAFRPSPRLRLSPCHIGFQRRLEPPFPRGRRAHNRGTGHLARGSVRRSLHGSVLGGIFLELVHALKK